MTLRLKMLKLGLLALIAAVTASLDVCALAGEAPVKQRDAGLEPVDESIAASLHRRPAMPFAIRAVLAEFDRAQALGPEAIRLASLAPRNGASTASPLPLGSEPFGLLTSPAPEDALWHKWRGVESDIAAEQVIMDRCRANTEACPSYAAQFLRLVGVVKSKSGRAELDETNRAVNASIRYVSDLSQFGEVDRWSAPLATFATTQGDCEDYAIAKYVALREAGFPRDDLQLVLVRDRAAWQDHAVLLARVDGRWLILDNRNSELVEDIDAATLTPLYAIDHRGVRLFAEPYASRTPPDDGIEATPAAAAADDGAEMAAVVRTR